MRNQAGLFLIALFFLAMSTPLQAFAQTPSSSASLATTTVSAQQIADNRGKVLRAYLQLKNSPLQDDADYIIQQADKNNIDWRLIPAISGVESTYCQAIPFNSYNCWGYGIYGNNVRRFTSYQDGIATVSSALRSDYMNKWGAKDVYQIGKLYAASPTWASRVDWNMHDIETYSAKFDDSTLSITP